MSTKLGAIHTERVRFADVPAFIILKALAMDHRQEPKDAEDLIHVIRYAGTLDEVADMFVERVRSGLHAEAIKEGLAALKLRFCDVEHAEGYRKVGPMTYPQFHNTGDADELIRDQLFAAGLTGRLPELINEKMAS